MSEDLKIRDFGLKESGNIVKKRGNKKLAMEAAESIKAKGVVGAEDYVKVIKDEGSVRSVEKELGEMKENNALGVPNSFYELTVPEQGMMMFFLSRDFVHPLTRKRTHMNVTQSYIASHLNEDEIFSIWEKIEMTGEEGEPIGEAYTGKVKNYKKLHELEAKALSVFSMNSKMGEVWRSLSAMTFGVNPEDLLKTAILQDALHSNDYRDKNANRKMALEMLGIGKDKESEAARINVFTEGGGKELAEVLQKFSNQSTVVTIDDLEYVEEE